MSRGSLEIITGCMFSGKTEELLRRIRRAEMARQNVLLCKPTIDNRYSDDMVVTHNKSGRQAILIDVGDESIEAIIEWVGSDAYINADVIGFDEGNFFSNRLVDLVLKLIDDGKRVIIAGLDLTYDEVPFGPMPYLMAYAGTVDKLKAVCVLCGSDADRTQRMFEGIPAPLNGPQIDVNGEYRALCKECYDRTYGEINENSAT